MIRHLVILHFKKDAHANYYDLLCATKPLILSIAGVMQYEVCDNDSCYTPEGVHSLAVEIFFEDQAALDGFMQDPKHYQANSLFEHYFADPAYMVLTHEVKACSESLMDPTS